MKNAAMTWSSRGCRRVEKEGPKGHVRDTSLVSPWAVLGNVDALSRGDREILVPNDLPVCGRRLVEEKRANGEAPIAKDGRREPSDSV